MEMDREEDMNLLNDSIEEIHRLMLTNPKEARYLLEDLDHFEEELDMLKFEPLIKARWKKPETVPVEIPKRRRLRKINSTLKKQ